MTEPQKSDFETSASTELTGGAGFTYEDSVVGYFLAMLLLGDTAAGLTGSVVRVAVQQRPAGQPLDDVVVDARDNLGDRRLSLQVKRSLTISAAASNNDFRTIIADCRATRADPAFHIERDMYGFVTQTVAIGPLRDFRRIVELAHSSTNAAEFTQRFEGLGATSVDLRDLRIELRPLVAETDEAEWDFYRHFVVPDLSGLEPTGALMALIGSNLQALIAAGELSSGGVLFTALCRAARVGSGAGKIWTRPILLRDLGSDFRLRGIPAFTDDLETIKRATATALAEISDAVGVHHVDRTATVERAFTLLARHRLVNITGLAGCGKSAILRNAIERMATGAVLFLKSDLLVGTDWQGFAVAKGLIHRNPVDLLAEIGAIGNAVLFIDGIDRIPPPQRAIIKDLMRAIIEEPALERWRVLVTSRNQGMEPFRVWVPPALYAEGGIGELSLDLFDEDEAGRLAEQIPSLRPLLFGPEGVRSIARRPFFAAVLAGHDGRGAEAANAQSETDLISYWWGGGGYNAHGEALLMRQRALLDLAQSGQRSLGKAVRAMSLKPETTARLSELIEDEIVRTPDEHATYSFTHDIFFEWAYFRLLVALGNEWASALTEAGQPPLLGRVVGLLAQRAITLGQPWNDGLSQLNNPDLRPQWRRAWITGPAASPQFSGSADRFTSAMEADDWALLRSFLVWFQAEHTIPNPVVLENKQIPLNGAMRVQLADLAGWPADLRTWTRALIWLISLVDRVPVRLLPLILELFKVWQNQLAAFPNFVSEAILSVCAQWLKEIETLRYREDPPSDWGRWEVLPGDAFEGGLRQIILLAMRAYPEPGNAVLDRAISNGPMRRNAYASIVGLSSTIATVSPQRLADLARAELLETLPKDVIAEEEEQERRQRERLARIRAKPAEARTEQETRALSSMSLSSFGRRDEYDLRILGMDRHHQAYFPTSPLHEPFASLFRAQPDIARALVRDIGNHATTAWRQIHELAPDRYGTPIPLDLDFPWGRQRLWGNWDSYNWIGQHLAPQPLACAFMALAYWAHKELERGGSVDELIQQVVEGHQSWAVLSLAGALALEANHASTTILPIATSQRLWKMDMARAVQEPMRGVDLFGVGALSRLTGEKEVAMNYLTSRPSRHREIRNLAPFFVLSPDRGLSNVYRERLALFPAELPYDYEEERANDALGARLRDQAEQWAGLGDESNYSASPMPDGKHVAVEYESPIPLSEGARQRAEEAVVSLNEFGVAAWARKSLQARVVDPSNTLENNLAFVRTRDTPTLFDRLTPSGAGMTQSAISGVAACVLLLGAPSPEDEAWALDVMRRVETMQEKRDYFGGGNIPWHPAFHLIAVLRTDLEKPQAQLDAARRIFGLCLHPNTNVARSALATLLNNPDVALAWNATVLASDLWQYHEPNFRRGGERDYTAQREAEVAAVSRAIARFADGTIAVPAPLPEPWPKRWRHGVSIFDEDEIDGKQEPIISFDHHSAAEIIGAFPVDTFCYSETYKAPFLAYIRDLVTWTAARFNPEDADSSPDRRRRREWANLNHWPARLGELLSRIGPYVDIEAMRTDYLGPFLEPDDENGLDVTTEFAQCVVCRHVFDAPSVTPHAIALLQLCLDQLLADPIFRRDSYRAGQLHGFHLPHLVKALLFVSLDQPAPGSAHFANGDWTNLPTVLPLVDQFVGKAGWAPYVMETFLTMVERAGLSYPIDAFVALMTKVLTELGDNADSWVGTMIPARIAGGLQVLADGNYPLEPGCATALLRLLDMLIDLGDRRAAALEESETFRSTQTG